MIDRTLGTGDHKTIGRLWIISGLIVGAIALVVRGIAAVELLDNSADLLLLEDANELVQFWSAGRVFFIFGSILPILIGLGIFIVPLQVGANTVAFPRGAAASYWTWLISAGMLGASYLANGGPGGGTRDFVVLWALALGGVMAAVVWALVCLGATVLGARAPGMDLGMVPATAWSYFVFALLGILAVPVQVGQLIIGFIDIRGNYLSLVDTTPLAGIMDTITLAPTVYWLIIPVLGIALDAIVVHTERPLRFHRSILVAIGVLAHTAFAAGVTSFSSRGRAVDYNNAFLVVALIASALPILAALVLAGDSLGKGRRSARLPLAAGLISGSLALLGAIVALVGVVDPIVGFFADLAGREPATPDLLTVNGTTFNAGVTTLILTSALVGCLAGILHWGHKMWGHQISKFLGSIALFSVAGGGVLWAAGEIVAGLGNQPSLPAVVAVDDSLVSLGNLLTLIGIAGTLAGVGTILLAVASSGLLGTGSVAEPWKGFTLEWQTESPPHYANFDSQPVVGSAYPLFDADAVATEVRSAASSTGAKAQLRKEVTA